MKHNREEEMSLCERVIEEKVVGGTQLMFCRSS